MCWKDENIHGVKRLTIEIKALPADDPTRVRTVYLRGDLQRRITRRIGQIYDPREKPDALHFAMMEMSSVDYDVQEPVQTPERELYERTGLSRLLDSNTGKYQTSLLQVLDETNRDQAASPLFRAWLFGRVCEMIDVQPVEWGAIWTPDFARDRTNLFQIGTRQIHSGDWLIPTKIAALAPALNAHFATAANHSYARQAFFYQRLLPKVLGTGVTLAGYCNIDGVPVLNPAVAGGPVMGFTDGAATATVIFDRVSPTEPSQPRAQPMPFSPLFIANPSARPMIDATLQSLGYSAAAVGIPETLPPILRSSQ